MSGLQTRRGRFLMLAGSGLATVVFALALFVHSRLYSNDLSRAERLTEQVRQRLDAQPENPVRLLPGHASEGFEAALRQAPVRAATALDALLLYDESERSSFAALRWPGGVAEALPTSGLLAPQGVSAVYEAGAVSVRWTVAPATRDVIAGQLDLDQQVGHRIYRTVHNLQGLGDSSRASTTPEWVASLDHSTTRWRDDDMPLTGGELSYEVWTVLLRATSNETPTLVRSESGELVTVTVPEHFRLQLVSGDDESVVLSMEVGPASMPVAVHHLTLSPGDPVVAGEWSTGLTVRSLELLIEDRLTTRTRLVFTSEARLVLDPVTNTPRTSDTQVLMPQTRLVATLAAPSGATRRLELDLQ